MSTACSCIGVLEQPKAGVWLWTVVVVDPTCAVHGEAE
jgi:hypothetical protein